MSGERHPRSPALVVVTRTCEWYISTSFWVDTTRGVSTPADQPAFYALPPCVSLFSPTSAHCACYKFFFFLLLPFPVRENDMRLFMHPSLYDTYHTWTVNMLNSLLAFFCSCFWWCVRETEGGGCFGSIHSGRTDGRGHRHGRVGGRDGGGAQGHRAHRQPGMYVRDMAAVGLGFFFLLV